MPYVGKVIKPNGDAALVGSTLYGTCDTEADVADKVVDCPDFSALITGVTIHVKFTHTNISSEPTINVNSTGRTRLCVRGVKYAGPSEEWSWHAGAVIALTYDGANWIMNDWINSQYSLATSTNDGLISKDDKSKLDGIEDGANAYSLPTMDEVTKGGARLGSGLSVTDDVLSVNTAAIGLDSLSANVSGLQTNVSGLQTSVSGLQTSVATNKSNIDNISSRVKYIETSVTTLEDSVVELAANTQVMVKTITVTPYDPSLGGPYDVGEVDLCLSADDYVLLGVRCVEPYIGLTSYAPLLIPYVDVSDDGTTRSYRAYAMIFSRGSGEKEFIGLSTTTVTVTAEIVYAARR